MRGISQFFFYFYFLISGNRIPQITSLPLLSPNHTSSRAKEMEHTQEQKKPSRHAEVGHVRKHLRFLEATTSKDHSLHDGEIKARWRSGLRFKYSWVCEGGRRWEGEFWNWTCTMTSLPHPNSDSNQVRTHSKPRSGQGSYLLKWPLSENIILSRFILFKETTSVNFIFTYKKGLLDFPSGSTKEEPSSGHGSLTPACTPSLIPRLSGFPSHTRTVLSSLSWHKVLFDKRKLGHRNVCCTRSHHKLVAQQGLDSSSPNSSPVLFSTGHNTSVTRETSARKHQDQEAKQFICMSF